MTENKESLGQLKETLSPQAKALVSAMEEVYKNHKNLGESGKKKEKLNQFGDMAMTGDVGAENMTLNSALGYSTESGKVIEFRGEESGNGLITNGEVQYWKKEDKSQESGVIDEFWVMDGIDGSENYANKTEWPYGTMVAIANKADPNYEDFTNAGVTMEEEGWVVLATRDSQKPGVYVIDLNNGNVSRLPNFNQENIFNHDNILADNYFTEAKALIEKRPELGERRTGSTAATAVSMVIRNLVTDYKYPKMNEIHDELVDVTRKGNLEQPTVYLLLKLLGGEVLDINGDSIGDKKFKSWGQQEHLAIFPMTNPEQFSELKKFLELKETR